MWINQRELSYLLRLLLIECCQLIVIFVFLLDLFNTCHTRRGPAWVNRWLIRALGVSYEVRGVENIRKDHGAVILMNHQSLIDLSVLAHLWPIIGRATVVAKRELLYAFVSNLKSPKFSMLKFNVN